MEKRNDIETGLREEVPPVNQPARFVRQCPCGGLEFRIVRGEKGTRYVCRTCQSDYTAPAFQQLTSIQETPEVRELRT